MYADRLIEEACFSAQNECPNGQSEMFGPGAAAPCSLDGCGHGTRVAGIVLGDEPGGGLTGVAPHADLIAIQIFSDIAGELGAYSSDILAGLQHILGLAAFHQIASANLSIGGDLFTSEADCDRTVASQFAAVALLRAANVLTVAASGNEGLTNAMTTPGCLSNVIAVGSTSDFDEISSFSNSASFLRLLAPGEVVESSVVGGGTDLASGTSMAASHVAGGIAAIREAIPSATADEIENALALSGVPVFDARNGITRPRIQVPEAITFLEANGPQPGGGNGGTTPATTTISGDGGGGTCGFVGIEPFLVLGLVRLGRWRRFAKRQQA
jgi:subtilisin family serine protease